jgi:glutathione S-transferase
MKLIGMLDSPYVRRVAITLDLLQVPFEHEAVSVFSTFERFRGINPVVKAPTLVCHDGGVLMDSGLILQYVEREYFPAGSSLWSREPEARLRQFRTVSFASAAADKIVQFVYEKQLRPPAAQHEPWKQRVRGQFTAAFAELESLVPLIDGAVEPGEHCHHGTLWPAIVWHAAQSLAAEEVPAQEHPRLVRLSQRFEELPLFKRWPAQGPGVPAAV